MEIELSEDLQHYKESLVLGLTAKQFLFSALALGVGTGIVLLLYEKIGITLSCYVATPFVVPLALTGFYNYHGLTFWQFAGKMKKEQKKEKKGGDVNVVKKKAIRMGIVTVVMIVLGAAAAVWYKMYR